MKRSHVFVKSALVLAVVGAFGAANAATISSASLRDFALEACQPAATVFTLPAATYLVGAGGGATQDFYVTFTLTNGTFTATPAATVTAAAGAATATYISGGAGVSNVTFRINGSVVNIAPADTVNLTAGATATAASCSSPIDLSAANGLLFISGAVASPLEGVTNGATPNSMAKFTQAVTITMVETGSDPIDLNPTPSSNSRKVFGPAAALDGAAGTSPAETAAMLARRLAIVVGAQREPDNSAAFADVIDDLVISLSPGFDTSSISALAGEGLCMDDNADGACAVGEKFSLATGIATIAGGSWATNGGFLLFNDGTAFAPRTLTMNYALAVKVNAIRPGMTAHTYTYAAPTNNAWPIQYANGTLLRSQWFLSDVSNNSTLRLVNAGTSAAAVVDATYYLDSGATAQIVGLTSVAAKSGVNTPLNATSVPGLSTGPASRGYIEVTIAGDLINVEGSTITYNQGTLDRTTATMRNVTIDSGNRTAGAY